MKLLTTAVVWCAGVVVSLAAPGTIHLVQKPAMNKTEIVFSYSGDLWHVGRDGGIASRLTSGPGFESDAIFPPTARHWRSQANTTGMSTSSLFPLPEAFPSA